MLITKHVFLIGISLSHLELFLLFAIVSIMFLFSYLDEVVLCLRIFVDDRHPGGGGGWARQGVTYFVHH